MRQTFHQQVLEDGVLAFFVCIGDMPELIERKI